MKLRRARGAPFTISRSCQPNAIARAHSTDSPLFCQVPSSSPDRPPDRPGCHVGPVGTDEVARDRGGPGAPARDFSGPWRSKRAPGYQQAKGLEEVRFALTVRAAEDVKTRRRRQREGAIITKIDGIRPPDLHPLNSCFGRENWLLDPHRHYNTAVPLLLDAFNHARAQGVLQLEDDLLSLDGRDRVQEIARVEPDHELSAVVLDLEHLLRLPKILTRSGQAKGGGS